MFSWKFGPCFARRLAADRFGLGQGTPRLFEQPGIFNGQTDLVGEQAEHLDILFAKRACFCALHIQRPNDLFVTDQRQRHLGVGLGQLRVVEEHGVFTYIHGDTWLASMSYGAYNTLFTNPQAMMAGQHFPPTFAVCGGQNGIFIHFVQQEQADMIKTELVADHARDPRQELAQVTDRSNILGNLSHGLELCGAPVGLSGNSFQFQAALGQLRGPLLNPFLQGCLQMFQLLNGFVLCLFIPFGVGDRRI